MADDDATSALIAKMLAEDYAAVAQAMHEQNEYEYDSFSDEDNPKKKRKGAGKRGSAKPKAQTPPKPTVTKPVTPASIDSPNAEDGASTNPGDAVSATGRRKRKDSGNKREAPVRSWTDEEEAKFLSGLDQFGRDWGAIAAHIGTRDSRAVSSHAQKHFIRLYVDMVPLPLKVVESGSGYTLSGKPLDTTSAAFRAYAAKAIRLGKVPVAPTVHSLPTPMITATTTATTHVTDTTTTETATVTDGGNADINTKVTAPAVEDAKVDNTEKGSTVQQPVTTRTDAPTGDVLQTTTSATAPSNKKQKRSAKEPKVPKKPRSTKPRPVVEVDLAGRTEYSRQRSRRTATNPFQRTRDGALELVTLRKYQGDAGSNDAKSQPFRIVVSAHVVMLADCHSHLSLDEVIGFLGGKWDRDTRTLNITHVFPGKSVHGEGVKSNVQCEMDPLFEVKLRGEVEALGISVVGWYHSHPTFEPVPSQCDIDNQCNYQAFFRDHSCTTDPFVGLIVSPFDLRLPSLQSAVVWFNVACPQSSPTPMHVDVELDYGVPGTMSTKESGVDDVAKSETRVDSADHAAEKKTDAESTQAPQSDGDGVVESKQIDDSKPQSENGVGDQTSALLDGLLSCVRACVANVDGVDPYDTWRDLGGAVTNAQKLRGSLMTRCPAGDPVWTQLAEKLSECAVSLMLTGGASADGLPSPIRAVSEVEDVNMHNNDGSCPHGDFIDDSDESDSDDDGDDDGEYKARS